MDTLKVNLIIVCLMFFAWNVQGINKSEKIIEKIIEEEFEIGELDERQNKTKVRYYYFDKTGRILEEKETDPVEKNSVYGIEYKYNDNKLSSESIYQGDNRDSVSVRKYSYSDKLITIENNNITEKIYLDDNGNKVKQEIYYDNQRSVERTFKYTNNMLSQEKYKDEEGEEHNYVFEYNKGLLSKKREIDKSEKSVHSTKYSYNEKGLLIKEVSLYTGTDDASSFSYSYEYDKEGNWKQRNELLNGKLYSVIVRTIKYYE